MQSPPFVNTLDIEQELAAVAGPLEDTLARLRARHEQVSAERDALQTHITRVERTLRSLGREPVKARLAPTSAGNGNGQAKPGKKLSAGIRPEVYEAMLAFIREEGPISQKHICQHFGWQSGKASQALRYARSVEQVRVTGEERSAHAGRSSKVYAIMEA